MNGDAAEALARAKNRAAQATAKATPDPVARLVPEAARPPQRNRDLVIEHASEEPASPRLDVKGTPADIETLDGTLDFNAVAHSAAKAYGIEVQEEVVLKPQDLVIEGLAHTQFQSGIFAMPPEAAEDEPKIDLPLIMPDDGLDAAPPEPQSVAEEAPPAPAPPPAAVVLSDDDGAADTAALSRAEPVLTETMAELYLRQGHQEDALRVYQALLAKRPADRRLRGRVASLAGGGTGAEGPGTGETVQVFLKRILAARPGPTPSVPVGSSPLDDAFAIAHSDAELGPDAGVVSPGEATRPAADSISLDQVFGDEGPPSSGAALEPTPPAPSPAPQETGGFSFDQFFSPAEPAGAGGAGGVGGAPARPGEGGPTAHPPARSSGGRLRPPVEDEGDLDQFQAWLRGLKS